MDKDKIEPPDSHIFSAAVGWLGLGNVKEAKVELMQLRPSLQGHPGVLELRWLISAEEKNWSEGLEFAEALVRATPDDASGWLHRAYALRRVVGGSIQKAWEALLPAAEKFPTEELIAFNLACYACQMGHSDTAISWLKRAIDADEKGRIKQMALEDPDLQPLSGEIEAL